MYEVSCYKLAPNGGGGAPDPGSSSSPLLQRVALVAPLDGSYPRRSRRCRAARRAAMDPPIRGTREGGTMSGTLVFSHKMMVQHIPARRVAVHLMWPLHSIH